MGGVWGGVFPSPPGGGALVQTEFFLHSSPKAGLNAVLGVGEGQNVDH